MGGGASTQVLPEEDVDYLRQETHFTPQQIKRLWRRFGVIDAAAVGFMTREEFRLLPELSMNPLADRVLDCLEGRETTPYQPKPGSRLRASAGSSPSPGGEERAPGHHSHQAVFVRRVDFERFVRAIDVFSPLTDSATKLEFLFEMYDLDGDGLIGDKDLRFVFGRLVGQGTTRAQLDAMVRSAMRTWDANTDGKLSREEFARLVSPDELSAQMTVLLE